MSFDADSLFGEVKRIKRELDVLRSQSRTDFSGGGGFGGGFGVGGSTATVPTVHSTFALHPIIHNLEIINGVYKKIILKGASVIVDIQSGGSGTLLYLHTLEGALNNGQIITLKPKEGKTITLQSLPWHSMAVSTGLRRKETRCTKQSTLLRGSWRRICRS